MRHPLARPDNVHPREFFQQLGRNPAQLEAVLSVIKSLDSDGKAAGTIALALNLPEPGLRRLLPVLRGQETADTRAAKARAQKAASRVAAARRDAGA